MQPYYEDQLVTIYHGDSLEILPTLAPGMVVVTDQPYGTGWVRGGGKKAGEFNAKHEKPDWDVWDLAWIAMLNAPKRIAAFTPVGKCEELCAVLPRPVVLHYKKTNVRPGAADREPIVVSPPVDPREWKKAAYNGDAPFHPCQKPLEIMKWLIDSVSDEGDTILDPFGGSGSTGRASKDLGRRCILIEREEKYCEVAARRMAQEAMVLDAA